VGIVQLPSPLPVASRFDRIRRTGIRSHFQICLCKKGRSGLDRLRRVEFREWLKLVQNLPFRGSFSQASGRGPCLWNLNGAFAGRIPSGIAAWLLGLSFCWHSPAFDHTLALNIAPRPFVVPLVCGSCVESRVLQRLTLRGGSALDERLRVAEAAVEEARQARAEPPSTELCLA